MHFRQYLIYDNFLFWTTTIRYLSKFLAEKHTQLHRSIRWPFTTVVILVVNCLLIMESIFVWNHYCPYVVLERQTICSLGHQHVRKKGKTEIWPIRYRACWHQVHGTIHLVHNKHNDDRSNHSWTNHNRDYCGTWNMLLLVRTCTDTHRRSGAYRIFYSGLSLHTELEGEPRTYM